MVRMVMARMVMVRMLIQMMTKIITLTMKMTMKIVLIFTMTNPMSSAVVSDHEEFYKIILQSHDSEARFPKFVTDSAYDHDDSDDDHDDYDVKTHFN